MSLLEAILPLLTAICSLWLDVADDADDDREDESSETPNQVENDQ